MSFSSEVKGRMARGIGATALAPVITAIIQFGSVPLLLHSWGVAKYGDWLLLSAVPSYLSLSDLGFGDASGTDMSMRVAAGDRDGALRTFQSSCALLSVTSIVILLLAIPLTWFIPWHSWLNLSSLSDRQASLVVLVLTLFVVVGQQIGLLESGFRCEGNFAVGTFYWNIVRFSEASVATGVGLATGNLLAVALAYVATRLVGTIGYRLLLRQKSPWLKLGFRHAEMKTIKAMAKPALGFIALPAGHALNGQGLTVMIGAVLGPVAVTTFSTLRTLSRINFQIVNVIAVALWPELSTAFGKGDIALARNLHRRAYQFGLGLALVGGLALWFAGPFLYNTWTRHAVPFNATCFHLLLIATLANSLWFTSSVVPMSTNAHSRIALAFVAVCLVALGSAKLLIPHYGVTGAAMALLLIDGFMTWLVLRISLRQVNDTLADLFASSLGLPTRPRPDESKWVSPIGLKSAVLEAEEK